MHKPPWCTYRLQNYNANGAGGIQVDIETLRAKEKKLDVELWDCNRSLTEALQTIAEQAAAETNSNARSAMPA